MMAKYNILVPPLTAKNLFVNKKNILGCYACARYVISYADNEYTRKYG
jgi:hypothetical protein